MEKATASKSIVMKETDYGIFRATDLPFEEAVARVTEELKREGFGILTEIDVRATMKKKLDVDVPPYVILGACNPPLALEALTAEAAVGLLLPCNVVVSERPDGAVDVSALKPTIAFERLVRAPGIEAVAEDAEARIVRALDRVPGRGA